MQSDHAIWSRIMAAVNRQVKADSRKCGYTFMQDRNFEESRRWSRSFRVRPCPSKLMTWAKKDGGTLQDNASHVAQPYLCR
jgi:hypothetical protein